MPDILADAKAWIAENNGDTTEDHGEIEAMLRGLVKEVETLRKLVEPIVRMRSLQRQQAELLKLAPRAPWLSTKKESTDA